MKPFRISRSAPVASRQAGFTLIELMITVAIVAILAAVALPAYRVYAVRGKLVEGTNALAAARTSMEQFYQDNRQYTTLGTITSPCGSLPSAGSFTLSCTTLTDTSYVITAIGSGLTSGATYTINEQNTQTTESLPPVLGSLPTSHQCWIMRKGDSC